MAGAEFAKKGTLVGVDHIALFFRGGCFSPKGGPRVPLNNWIPGHLGVFRLLESLRHRLHPASQPLCSNVDPAARFIKLRMSLFVA